MDLLKYLLPNCMKLIQFDDFTHDKYCEEAIKCQREMNTKIFWNLANQGQVILDLNLEKVPSLLASSIYKFYPLWNNCTIESASSCFVMYAYIKKYWHWIYIL